MKTDEEIKADRTQFIKKVDDILNNLDVNQLKLTYTAMSYTDPWLISSRTYSLGDVTMTVLDHVYNHPTRYTISLGNVVLDHTLAVDHKINGGEWHSFYFKVGKHKCSRGTIGINLPKHIEKFLEDKALEITQCNKVNDDDATMDTLNNFHLCATGESIMGLTTGEALDKVKKIAADAFISFNKDPDTNPYSCGFVLFEDGNRNAFTVRHGVCAANLSFYPHFNNSVKVYLDKIHIDTEWKFKSLDFVIESEECYKIVLDNVTDRIKGDKTEADMVYESANKYLDEVKF